MPGRLLKLFNLTRLDISASHAMCSPNGTLMATEVAQYSNLAAQPNIRLKVDAIRMFGGEFEVLEMTLEPAPESKMNTKPRFAVAQEQENNTKETM